MWLDNLDKILRSLPPEGQREFLDGPALHPPTGIKPNFDNPPNLNALVRGVISVCLALATIAITLRVYSRVFVIRKIHLEDFLGVFGYILFVAFCVFGYRLTWTNGLFVHQWDIRVKNVSETFYVVNIDSLIYAGAMGCLKAAILLEWMHTFSPRGVRGFFWWACQALLWVNVVFYGSALIIGNLTCTPYQRIWDKTIPGTCVDRRNLDTANASLNLVSHFLILILPQRVIWKLQMAKTTKLGISLLFAIGIFASISAAFRLNATIKYLRSDDTTYYVCGMALWCLAEQTLVLLVFCIPALPKVFRRSTLLHKVMDSLRSWLTMSTKRSNHEDSASAAPSFQRPTYQKIQDDGASLPNKASQASKGLGLPGETRPPIEYISQVDTPPGAIIRTSGGV
ncbi:hypothetical protein F4779DRAFT_55561 [Xylariaceae sp. FL0662B]|nr:hypothetical protein F4779DRAFT_55561 [Xylariaceae sp. FL0662B]